MHVYSDGSKSSCRDVKPYIMHTGSEVVISISSSGYEKNTGSTHVRTRQSER